MPNLRTKIIAIFLILFSYKPGYSQLTLENIFLTDKYVPKWGGDIQFLHKKPLFARLVDVPKGKNIAFYNTQNKLVQEYKLSEYKSETEFNAYNWDDLLFSNSDNYFLVNENCNSLYRRSAECNYFIGDTTGTLTSLSSGMQYFPTFSADDKKIGFIKNNNLFYKNISENTEVQITNDGLWNKIINGKSDWVYEEELELTRAFEWNSKSDKIAYLKFDESNVKEYSIPVYYNMQYPNLFTYKYPKVGEENSKVSVWMYDVKSKKNKPVALPFPYEYIPRIYWNATGDEVIVMLLNRHQDSLQLVSYNTKTKKTRQLYLDAENAYVDLPKIVSFLSDNSFIINSERDGFNHLYHYDKDGNLLKQVTKGNFEVTDIYGVDEPHKQLYYQSNEGNEIETRIFRINYETLEKKKLSMQNGSNKAVFSNDFSFFVHTFSSATTPPQITIQQTDIDSTVLIENNKPLQDSLAMFPKKEFLKIPMNDYQLNAWIIKPQKLDSTKKYPLLMFVYGGPEDQEVLNQWQSSRDLYYNYLAEQGYIVACVDNRGTDGRGTTFKKCIYMNVGKLETEDQILAAKYFGNLSFIDKNRIGIFGWSYGGFMAANCLFEGNDIFKAAIAGAPVSNWVLYDDIYTEKYMRTYIENSNGYNNFNPNVLAKKLTGNLLLIHGTADDNVHFQNSVFLINALNDYHKTYQFYMYPDQAHGISGKNARYDVYTKIFEFLKEKL